MEISKLITIFILINISKCTKKPKRFYNFTENEFIDISNESKNTGTKWLMTFYTKQYHDYEKFMDLIKRDISIMYHKDENVKFGFIELNNNNAKWLTHIFNIKSIPFLLLVYKGGIYYFKEKVINFDNILKFIDEKKSYEDSHPIPDKITFKTKTKILFQMLINELTDNIQDQIDRFNINYKWSNKLTMILFIILTILFFIIEIYFIKSCCFKNSEYDDFKTNKNKKKIDQKNKVR